MKIRFDKYLWCVRLAKTRSQASELISKGKVRLNGQDVKASKEIKVNDVIGVQKHSATFEYKVLLFGKNEERNTKREKRLKEPKEQT